MNERKKKHKEKLQILEEEENEDRKKQQKKKKAIDYCPLCIKEIYAQYFFYFIRMGPFKVASNNLKHVMVNNTFQMKKILSKIKSVVT